MKTSNNNIPQTYIDLLEKFISFKSISADDAFKDECEQTVLWLQNLLEESGFETKLDYGPTTHPLLLAKYEQDKNLETILIYGHYDVQPASQDDGWDHDPFILTERDGRLSARGAIDNKGQVLVHIYTVLELIKQNNLNYNVIFLIEGNEESSNKDLPSQLEKYKDFIKNDYVLVSDGETTKNKPTMESSFRGGSNIRVMITTAPNNFHSGIYGGAVPNAALVLSQTLAKLKDENNNVIIRGFYDDVYDIPEDIAAANRSLATTEEILELSGVKSLLTEQGNDFYTQTGLRPTLEISGINSGYTGQGYLNIVPAQAEARINVRTVPGQNTRKVVDLVKDYITKNTPTYAACTFEEREPSNPIKLDTSGEKAQEIKKILTESYGDSVVIKNVGGSIPIVASFIDEQNMNVISVSLANEDCNMHGVHENFDTDMIEKALRFSNAFFRKTE